jgi:hypothetical protein
MRSKLTEYHDAEDASVFRWNERLALVQLSRWCVTLVPAGDEASELNDTLPAYRAGLTQLLEAAHSQHASLSFSELSMWANRRTVADAVGDPQVVLDATYNRAVIRESLQWLYQTRVPATASIDARTVNTTGRSERDGEEKPGRALIMRRGEWVGIVMNCIADAGDDPLFPEAP